MSKRTYIGIFIRVDLIVKDIEHVSKECPNGHFIPPHMVRDYCGDCGTLLINCKFPGTDIISTWDLHCDDLISEEDYDKFLVVTNVIDHTVRVDNKIDKVEHIIIRDTNGFYLDQHNSSVALDHTAVNGQQMVNAFTEQHADLLVRLKPHYLTFKVMYGVLQYYE